MEKSKARWSCCAPSDQRLRAHARVLGALGLPQMQYTFIYQALLEHYLYGDTELDVSSLEKHLQTLHGTATHFDKIGLEEEFRVSVNGLYGRTGDWLKEATFRHCPS